MDVTAYVFRNGLWDWFQSSTTDSLGNYNVGGLPTGTYRLEFNDYTDTYLGEYYNNAATLNAATGVAVTAGATTANINASLALPGHITGRVTNPGGSAIADVDVTAYSLQDGYWDYYKDASTNAAGNYDVSGLPTGTYRLEFWDGSGSYLGEYYNNVATLGAATGVAVTAGSTTANINAQLASAGHITGKVTNPGGTGISDIDVDGVLASGRSCGLLPGRVPTDSLGNYNIGGLPTGTYRVEFLDYDGAYAVEYYDNAQRSTPPGRRGDRRLDNGEHQRAAGSLAAASPARSRRPEGPGYATSSVRAYVLVAAVRPGTHAVPVTRSATTSAACRRHLSSAVQGLRRHVRG